MTVNQLDQEIRRMVHKLEIRLLTEKLKRLKILKKTVEEDK